MALFVPNRHRGKLIVVEGIDGSGKSTQISLLSHWLRSQGFGIDSIQDFQETLAASIWLKRLGTS